MRSSSDFICACQGTLSVKLHTIAIPNWEYNHNFVLLCMCVKGMQNKTKKLTLRKHPHMFYTPSFTFLYIVEKVK